ncbi:MAG: amidohydrolase family protein [Candidatus Lokiarchaeota archaeon]|nr:amidohydrolase family protein [Candidatus Lokiarchaeota archaeon]
MNRLIINNGLVFDPINNINGEIKDILIESGKIVEKFSSETNVKEIDAKGKTVIPSAIDIHTHVASQQVNWARLLGANNNKFKEIWEGLTLKNIARNYISNGYTFILEANVFPSLAKQTIFNFKQLPVLDKAMLLNISNFWPLELEFQRGKIDDMAIFLSDLLSRTYGFGIKIYNPFENENWNLNELRDDLSQSGRLYNFSALDVYENAVKCVETLGLPHSTHAHIEGYENEIGKRNLVTVIEKIKSLNLEANQKTDLNLKREQIFHLAHANSYNYDGNNENLIKFLNENQNFDIDVAFVGFNQINPVITSDRRLINSMLTEDINENPRKLISSAVEFEGDFFVFLRNLEKSNYNDCNLWANALDLALNVSNKFQVSFSLNFPNYANISDIPKIATWLLSKDARENFMKDMNNDFLKNNPLSNNDKVLNFSEFVCLTRVSPAKSLGLANIKGNLGLGADGDLNILDINIKDMDISKQHEELRSALSNMDYVIKSGTMVKKQKDFNFNLNGSIFWSSGKSEIKEKDFVMSKKKDFYQKYSSVFYDSYKVSIDKNLLRRVE